MQRNSGQRARRIPIRRRGKSRGKGGNALAPPPFVPTVKASHRFRFSNGANNGSFAITDHMLSNLLCYATSTTTSVRLIQAYRMRRVEMWANPPALGSAPTTCSVEWNGDNAPSTVVSDTTMGVRPAHVSSVPPAQSLARWWHAPGSDVDDTVTQFTISLPADSIVDVILDLRFVETEAPSSGDTTTGASLGQIYGDYLDGRTSGKLAPVGYVALP